MFKTPTSDGGQIHLAQTCTLMPARKHNGPRHVAHDDHLTEKVTTGMGATLPGQSSPT